MTVPWDPGDPNPAPTRALPDLRGIPAPPNDQLSIYVNTDELPAGLLDAVSDLLAEIDVQVEQEGQVVRGSWWQRWKIGLKRADAGAKIKELAEKLERAGELKYIVVERSVSEKNQADAVSAIIKSLEGVESAVIQLSSMLIVKHDGKVLARVLSEQELRLLEKDPTLLQSPGAILELLSRGRVAPTEGIPWAGVGYGGPAGGATTSEVVLP